MTVTINSGANSLAAGSYSDTVTLTNTTNGAGNTTRAVSLTVNATAGSLSVAGAGGLSSSGTAGGPFSPSALSYTLTNPGGTAIAWTAAKTQTWVTLSSSGGTLAAGGTATVTVTINSGANSLAAGSHSDTVTLTNTTNGAGNTTRAVSLTVNATAGSLSVAGAGGLSSSGTAGGPFSPSALSYTLTNPGGTAIAWTAAKTQTWVTLSSSGGTLAAGGTATVTVTINSGANSLAAGSHSDTVTLTNTTNGAGNTTRAVSLTVNATAGSLSVAGAGGLSSSGTAGGPFSPSALSYTLTNPGGTAIAWTAAKTQTWVTLSSSGGTLAAGGTATVTVTINSGANGLAAGSHSDTVTLTNTTNGAGNTTRAVSLTVNATAGSLSVAGAGGLSSSGTAGGPFSPSALSYTLTNPGGTAIAWTAAKTQTWVTLSSSGGTLAAGGTATVTVTINSGANSLAAGSYSDTVTLTNTTNGAGNTTRAVSLTVNATASLSSIAVSGPSSVNEGGTGSYTATGTWDNGTTAAITPTWSVSTTYATIGTGGVLTAATVTSNQTVTVTATYGGRTGTMSVTIVDVAGLPPAAPKNMGISGPISSGATEVWRIAWDPVTTYANDAPLEAGRTVRYTVYWTDDPALSAGSLRQLASSISATSVDFDPVARQMPVNQPAYLTAGSVLDNGDPSSLAASIEWVVANAGPVPPVGGKIIKK